MNGNKPNKVEIIAYPRIHLSLIGMNSGGYRINGGIGFSINNPSIKFIIEPSINFKIDDNRRVKFNKNELSRTIKILDKVKSNFKLANSANIIIDKSDALTHYGFGTSTMIRLACIEGLFIINGINIDKETIVSWSRRGGTSGTGINTYFDGGLVFDIGKKPGKSEDLEPSSAKEKAFNVNPLVIKRLNMPNWEFGICIPQFISSKTEKEENIFFNETCPIGDGDCYETLYHCIYGILGSASENDFDSYKKAVNKIQKTKWKRSEIELYGNELIELIAKLKLAGATSVGMSSLGPALIFTSNDLKCTITKLRKELDEISFYITNPRNSGRTIRYA